MNTTARSEASRPRPLLRDVPPAAPGPRLFRDRATWRLLEAVILPDLLARKQEGPLRIWCTGPRAADDALSALIMVTAQLGPEATARRVKIFATDAQGAGAPPITRTSYPASLLRSLAPRQRHACFEAAASSWTVRQDLRDVLLCGRHDLATQAPLARIDLLLCSVSLARFDGASLPMVLKRLHFGLAPEGRLVVEQDRDQVIARSNLYVPVVVGGLVFEKIGRPSMRALRPLEVRPDPAGQRHRSPADGEGTPTAEGQREVSREVQHGLYVELQAALEEMEHQNDRLQRLSEELALSNARQASELGVMRREVGQLAAVFRTLDRPVMVIRDDGTIVACSVVAAELFGHGADELSGQALDLLFDGEVPPGGVAGDGDGEPAGPITVRIRHRDGETREIVAQTTALSVDGVSCRLLTLGPAQEPAAPDGDPAAGLTGRHCSHLQDLTPREREVLELLVQGQQSKQIAHALGISRRTVDVHRSSLIRKTGTRSLADLFRLVIGEAAAPDGRAGPADPS